MHEQAPVSYIAEYYKAVREKNRRYPDVAGFWQGALGFVDGETVLNLGCGPMFFDNMAYFSNPPKHYVGIDLNENSFEFLKKGDDSDLVAMRNAAAQSGANFEYLSADIFDWTPENVSQFDCILGLGFFGTFYGVDFARLVDIAHGLLKPAGKLLKITWHRPHRSDEETRGKLQYRYDNSEEPLPDELVAGFEKGGFFLKHQSLLACDPNEIGFEFIQVCLFEKC